MSWLGRTDRMWVVGGVLCAAVLLAISWFFLVSPQHDQTGSLNAEAASAAKRVTSLQQRLAELRKQNEHLAQYQDQLANDRKALPTSSGLSDLLRELQAAGDATGVSVSGLSVGGAASAAAPGGPVYALPLTVTAKGPVERLDKFLDQLQQVQPRALLINTATVTVAKDGVTLALTIEAFVAASAPVPSASASASVSPSASASASPSPRPSS
jgi:Tfp pilus assembly protein PilO